MTFRTLIRRSLRFHARSHLGVLAGATIGSAVLIGALTVGDSVHESLRRSALNRLGPIHFALSSQDRLFVSDLDSRLRGPFASALVLPGTAATQTGTARANRVSVFGVSGRWRIIANWLESNRYPFDATRKSLGQLLQGQEWDSGQIAFVNDALARQLGIKVGDEIIVRILRPTALGMETPVSPREEGTVGLRLKVGAILPGRMSGNFAISAGQGPPANVFIPLDPLVERLGLDSNGSKAGAVSSPTARANLLIGGPLLGPPAPSPGPLRTKLSDWLIRLAPRKRISLQGSARLDFVDSDSLLARLAWALRPVKGSPIPDQVALSQIEESLRKTWTLEDAQLSVQRIELPQSATGGEYIHPFVEVSSPRVFLSPPVVAASLKPRVRLLSDRANYYNDTTNDLAFSGLVTNGVQVLTYLVNLIETAGRSTPYSMVTAANAPYVPADIKADEILVNDWLADDLGLFVGDSVQLSYFVVDSGKQLVQRTNSFRVRSMVPMKGLYADKTLMPDFPGVAKAETTHDWDAGFPLTYKIREKDETYWKEHRGTPKAFITLAAGQAMWGNRFGSVTAIRYPVPTNSFASTCREAVYRNILANLTPEEVGLHFEPVREQALKAADQSQDFGQLFLGFSFFLVVAALLLMALLFQFGLEQRVAEIGTLLALGFRPGKVRRLFLSEGAALALLGGILGSFAGLGYAKAMLWGLTTIWRDAIAASALQFFVTPSTIFIGLLASTVVAILTLWLTLRKQARQPARELLAGETVLDCGGKRSATPQSKSRQSRSLPKDWSLLTSAATLVLALAIIIWALLKGETSNPEAFFSAGSLLLIGGLAGTLSWLRSLTTAQSEKLTLTSLGVRACARRRKRSVATIALLASGCFLIVSIGVFRLDANQDATKRSSGTGGFALLGDSALPVVQDLNTDSGRDAFALSADALSGVHFVPFRVHDGDDASCLNLNRAQKPRLLGVNPEALTGRFTFAKVAKGLDRARAWELLRNQGSEEEIPAIGDANSIQWALGKKLGDTLEYTDERGQTFKLRLVGAVANSILQGNLLIDEAAFLKRFPNESGYRMFLLDAPSNKVAEVSTTLSRALQDDGLELTPTVQRLNQFNAVQNTYLGTFQILGGLGLLLGSAGLGIVVLRNVLERRGELALLTAVGFTRASVQKLVLGEHAALLLLGLGLGTVTAVVAVLPALLSPAQQLPWLSLSLTLGAVILNGLLWTWLATTYAVRGDLLRALRNE